jgi:hypothetical protein
LDRSRRTSSFRSKYTPNILVPALYREKHVNSLGKLWFLTNPIDILAVIHKAYWRLVRFFAPQEPKPSDFVELFQGLIAVNPPMNGVSIATFIYKWRKMNLIPNGKEAAEAFLDAVGYLSSLKVPEAEEE